MTIFALFIFLLFIHAIVKTFSSDELIQQLPFLKLKKQWTLLAKELGLQTNLKGNYLGLLKTGFMPTISGVKEGFPITITFKKTSPIMGAAIECSIQMKNPSNLNFTLLPKVQNAFQDAPIPHEEFYTNVKMNTRTPKEAQQVISPKIKTSILKLFRNQNNSSINLSPKKPKLNSEDLLLDFQEKNTLNFVIKEISIVDYNEKNHIKDVISLLINLAKRIEQQK